MARTWPRDHLSRAPHRQHACARALAGQATSRMGKRSGRSGLKWDATASSRASPAAQSPDPKLTKHTTLRQDPHPCPTFQVAILSQRAFRCNDCHGLECDTCCTTGTRTSELCRQRLQSRNVLPLIRLHYLGPEYPKSARVATSWSAPTQPVDCHRRKFAVSGLALTNPCKQLDCTHLRILATRCCCTEAHDLECVADSTRHPSRESGRKRGRGQIWIKKHEETTKREWSFYDISRLDQRGAAIPRHVVLARHAVTRDGGHVRREQTEAPPGCCNAQRQTASCLARFPPCSSTCPTWTS